MANRFSGNDYRGAFTMNNYPKAPDLGLQALHSYQASQARQAPKQSSGGFIGAVSRGIQNLTKPTAQVAGGQASQKIVDKLLGK